MSRALRFFFVHDVMDVACSSSKAVYSVTRYAMFTMSDIMTCVVLIRRAVVTHWW